MFGLPIQRQERRLLAADTAIAECASVDDLVELLRASARGIALSDGVTIVRREGDEVVYLSEDAISPLWAGQRFPLVRCITGMAMIARAPIAIPDIMVDPRVPLNLYLSTFVRAMVAVPVGHGEPSMAIGAYWRQARPILPEAIARLTTLARIAGDRLAWLGPAPISG